MEKEESQRHSLQSAIFRVRPEIRLYKHQDNSGAWVAHDPVSQQYYRLGNHEAAILRWLDGTRTTNDLQQKFSAEFAPLQIDAAALISLVGSWLQHGLIAPSANSLSPTLSEDSKNISAFHQSKGNTSWLRLAAIWLGRSISFRIRGVNPSQLLESIAPRMDWLFSSHAVLSWTSVAALAFLLMAFRADEVLKSVPDWQILFSPQALLGLSLIFVLTRFWHELGHAVACHRQGAICHDIGLLVMMGMPCVYCDTTDSWRLPSRWQRAAVAAAGMYMELTLAGIAAWLWLITQPGWLHDLSIQIILVSTVSTWLFNANPLMRYDGYYILADIIDCPNLKAVADRTFLQWIKAKVFGVARATQTAATTLPWAGLLGFSIAALVYKLSLSVAIAGCVWAWLAGFHLDSVGLGLSVFLIGSWYISPIQRSVVWLWKETASGEISIWRTIGAGALLGVVIFALLFTPLPNRIALRGHIVPAESRQIYSQVDGIITKSLAHDGQSVAAGQAILKIQNYRTQSRIADLEARVIQIQDQIEEARQNGFYAPQALDRIAPLRDELASCNEILAAAHRDANLLEISSEVNGTLLALPAAAADDLNDQHLADYKTYWLQPENTGRYIPAGTPICEVVVNPQRFIVVELPDKYLPRISEGAIGNVEALGFPGQIVSCTVTRIAEYSAVSDIQQRIAMGFYQSMQSTASKQSPSPHLKNELPANDGLVRLNETAATRFVAILELPSETNNWAYYGEVRLVMKASNRTIADHLSDWVIRTFRSPI